jgi:hypothetical protein
VRACRPPAVSRTARCPGARVTQPAASIAVSPAHPDHFIAALRWLGVAAAIGWLAVAALVIQLRRSPDLRGN